MRQVYTSDERELWIPFNLDDRDAESRMRMIFDSFPGFCELMAVDEAHPVLVVKPGGAKFERSRR